jgi:hypothetical protein
MMGFVSSLRATETVGLLVRGARYKGGYIDSGCPLSGAKAPYLLRCVVGPAEAVPLLKSRFLKRSLGLVPDLCCYLSGVGA